MEKNENNLMLLFKDDSDNNVSLTLRNAKEGLEDKTVSEAMDEIISSGCILSSAGNAITTKVKFAYIDKTTTELTVLF